MQFKIFKGKNIIQGISESKFGSMAGKRGDKNAIRFLSVLGYKTNIENLIWAKQVFGSKVHICKETDSGKIIKDVDGLISNISGQVLAIVSADCVPILLFDPKNKAIAALHGSRNSLVKGIVKKAVSKMVLNFSSRPKEILVAIAPHIRKRHYWLKEKTYRELKNTYFKKYFLRKKGKIYFDLTQLAVNELLKIGIRNKNIEDCKICTFCQHRKYFSARKKEVNPRIYEGKNSRFGSFISLKENKVLKFFPKNFKKAIKTTVKFIKEGKVLVCPTDTVYGLVADATNKKAVGKIFRIKKRQFNKPIPIFVKDIGAAKKLAQINKKQEKFLKEAWPGKITAVLKRKKEQKIYGIDKKKIGLRVPKYKFINALLKKINRPLTGTSANISGKLASTKIKEVLKQFENEIYQPDIILDAGNLPKNRPSTVIDLTAEKPKVLRK